MKTLQIYLAVFLGLAAIVYTAVVIQPRKPMTLSPLNDDNFISRSGLSDALERQSMRASMMSRMFPEAEQNYQGQAEAYKHSAKIAREYHP
jgi:hypothetical protein